MSKREFKATEGLLHDVMRKQAGTIEKAILEGVMNSVDAGANNIDIILENDLIRIKDDGKGMTSEEVDEYFEKFGLKDDDIEDKDFGKFRMGRGQIFNFGLNIWHSLDNVMVIDLDNDEATVTVNDEEYTLDTTGLSYNLIESDETYDGCSIEVRLYNELDEVSSVRNEVHKLIKYIPWMHDVTITINGSEYARDFQPDEETESAFYKFGREGYKTDTLVYNQGAFVTELDLNETGGAILSKKDLDVNFARNDILDTCEVFNIIEQEYNHLTRDHLAETDDLREREKIWLLNQASGDDRFLQEIGDKPLITDVTGSDWSFSNLKGEKVTFATDGSDAAKKMMETSSVVAIKRVFRAVVKELVDDSLLMRFEDAIDSGMMLDMKEYPDEELSKKRRKNLARARYFLDHVGFDGDVRGGFSDERNVWKNDENAVVIHKNVLKESKKKFLTEFLFQILEAAAHDGSMRETVDHGFEFRRNFWKYSKNAGQIQYALLEGRPEIERYANL